MFLVIIIDVHLERKLEICSNLKIVVGAEQNKVDKRTWITSDLKI